ncbi:hypothetical protein [uncultured Gilliamella sp.]|uniref:hypothetical protein n=1 Tax=uncultured Gilliamella sp. TaxID=1193505 RepID=UPI0025D3FE10|nr:hypothetical protein [uncultured Gilliamella sp.]
MSWYKAGTINVTKNSKTVIGTKTKWADPLIGICSGQMLMLHTANTIEIYEIESIQSDTQLTLAKEYSGESYANITYEIPTSPKVSIESLALRVAEMLSYYQQQMDGWQKILTNTDDVTLTAPDGQTVTVKSQKKMADLIDNAIKRTGVKNQFINGSLEVNYLAESGHRVYSPNNKPDPDEINALPAIKSDRKGIPIYVVNNHLVCSDWIGEHRLMPFRREELPFGWYFRNGDNYLLSSPQGQALNRLSNNYKADHRIVIKEINGQKYINVPTAFAPDGRGYFVRAVDGRVRQVGSVEGDAIRNIRGALQDGPGQAFIGHDNVTNGMTDGAISIRLSGDEWLQNGTRHLRWAFFDFDASRAVPTGPENTVINEGGTPVIYLGV